MLFRHSFIGMIIRASAGEDKRTFPRDIPEWQKLTKQRKFYILTSGNYFNRRRAVC